MYAVEVPIEHLSHTTIGFPYTLKYTIFVIVECFFPFNTSSNHIKYVNLKLRRSKNV